MQWMKRLLTLSLASSCLLLASCAHRLPLAVDSYCQVYEPIVQKRGDEKIGALLVVKQRILYNEQMYRNECKKVAK